MKTIQGMLVLEIRKAVGLDALQILRITRRTGRLAIPEV